MGKGAVVNDQRTLAVNAAEKFRRPEMFFK